MGSAVVDHVDRLRAALADRYELDGEIGRGGMASVYRARDRHHDRTVAVKVFRPELASLVGGERFLREIHIAAHLQHPHILPLFDSGVDAGLLYYVMPCVDGETLRQRIAREGPLPLSDVGRILGEVADALDFAHRHGIIHRDIKPANILLSGYPADDQGPSQSWHALVADFGIAKALSAGDAEAMTASGIVVGTPEYMSPEQSSGDGALDGRADVYSLGCVAYEMLAGEPPFHGRSVQHVLARHRLDPPPRIGVVRPAMPAALDDAVQSALAKVPADRFASAGAFARAVNGALTAPVAAAARLDAPRRARAAAAAASLAIAGLGVLWGSRVIPAKALDANKVMVLPLTEHGQGSASDDAGEQIAIIIGSALEHTEPLKWIDGWTWMDEAQRRDPRGLTGRASAGLSRRQHARYFIDGSVVRTGDSATVVVRLHDAGADSVVTQASAAGSRSPDALPQLGLRALAGVLPTLLEPRRRVDPGALRALSDRKPAAIVSWLQGEREYRRSHFREAQAYYERAVQADSELALAALKGAEAAYWTTQYADAERLVQAALGQQRLLPSKYAAFARGLEAYLGGRADSAAARFREAIAADGSWSEAWMALGEVYYHLLADPASAAVTAEQAFENARRLDRDFAPPLLHLAEIALRRGQVSQAEDLFARFSRSDPDSLVALPLGFALECARTSRRAQDWGPEAARHPLEVLEAGQLLSVTAAQPRCAAQALRSVFESAGAPLNLRAFAAFNLHNLLIATGSARGADAVLGEASTAGFPDMDGLAIADAEIGMAVGDRAAGAVPQQDGDVRQAKLLHLWYLGVWSSLSRDTATLASVAGELERRAAAPSPEAEGLARGMEARLALARGDSADALAKLAELRTAAKFPQVTWGIWQPLGSERLLRAELLLARGRPREALEQARELDHPSPVAFLVYLRRSLDVRLRAVQQLGWRDSIEAYRSRQVALDRWRSPGTTE